MITESTFKGCKSIELENDYVRVIVLPTIGGKIASFFLKDKNFELMFQNKEEIYRKANLYDDFAEFDASGFDDAFPSIDSSKVEYAGKIIEYPDHGEIWTADFNYTIDNEQINMTYNSEILPCIYTKGLSLDGNSLNIEYNIFNKGKEGIPCIWAMHCLVNCEDDMKIIFPKETSRIEVVCETPTLGKVGDIHPYPLTKTIKGTDYRLDKIMPVSTNNMEKYYVRGKVSEGMCGVDYIEKSVKFRVYFDKEKLPYLGFWVTSGGFRGDYNCALEPTNGYYDSIDIAKKNALFELQPDKNLNFVIRLQLL